MNSSLHLPERFEGLLTEFLDEFVVPLLPTTDSLAAWTEALLRYYGSSDPIYIVRGPRRGELRRENSIQIVESDNSPGIWCFLRALDGGFEPSRLEEAINLGNVPVLAVVSRLRKGRWNYAARPLSSGDKKLVWGQRLKHSHLLPLKGSELTLRQRALRNLNPANHFLFPNGNKHFLTERVGWSEAPQPSDLGESPRVLQSVAWLVRERMTASERRIHASYLSAAGAEYATRCPDDVRVRIVRR